MTASRTDSENARLRKPEERFGKADLPHDLESLVRRVIGLAMEVHSTLGPGLIERHYEEALCYELRSAGLPFHRQREVVATCKPLSLRGQRIDLVVDDRLVLELKSVSELAELHRAQLLSYLQAGDFPVGLLMNFNTLRLRDGIARMINSRSSAFAPFAPSSPPSRTSRTSRISRTSSTGAARC